VINFFLKTYIIISIGAKGGVPMEDIFLKEMGKRVSTRRKSLSLTQEALAEKMNVSIQMISNLELGKKAIRPENLAKLCGILNISADYILTGKELNNSANALTEKIHRLPDDKIELVNEIVDLCIKNKK
jgi:transcriptional regulator with XRE-family HTH domain